jgi:hypothetical protein
MKPQTQLNGVRRHSTTSTNEVADLIQQNYPHPTTKPRAKSKHSAPAANTARRAAGSGASSSTRSSLRDAPSKRLPRPSLSSRQIDSLRARLRGCGIKQDNRLKDVKVSALIAQFRAAIIRVVRDHVVCAEAVHGVLAEFGAYPTHGSKSGVGVALGRGGLNLPSVVYSWRHFYDLDFADADFEVKRRRQQELDAMTLKEKCRLIRHQIEGE